MKRFVAAFSVDTNVGKRSLKKHMKEQVKSMWDLLVGFFETSCNGRFEMVGEPGPIGCIRFEGGDSLAMATAKKFPNLIVWSEDTHEIYSG